MPYTTTDKIQDDLQGLTLASDSQPTVANVEEWIVALSGEMDQRMQAAGVDVPVTGPQGALDYLERICVAGVLARIYGSIQTEADERELRLAEYNTEMERIAANPAIVRATAARESQAGYNTTDAGARTVVFKRHTTQW